jgi:hypothetical protein
MCYFILVLFAIATFSCKNNFLPIESEVEIQTAPSHFTTKQIKDTGSWEYFLQHLPEKDGPIVDYKGRTVSFQQKYFALINYDVGTRDLQQCADALMRLRSEYLFAKTRFAEIGFHFTSGHYYSFADYCKGKKPIPKGNNVHFTYSLLHKKNAQSLRRYLDIVYTYAGTISLAAELKNTSDFAIGTIVISPGSPGHCFIITNEATTPSGEKLYKLVEGYTPAQSIYVLRNMQQPSLGFWHSLKKERIITASYEFTSYKLKKF